MIHATTVHLPAIWSRAFLPKEKADACLNDAVGTTALEAQSCAGILTCGSGKRLVRDGLAKLSASRSDMVLTHARPGDR